MTGGMPARDLDDQPLRRARVIVPLAGAAAVMPGRVGPKAAMLATLRRAGVPVPDGFCVAARAYRTHLSSAGLAESARRAASVGEWEARRLGVEVRLGLLQAPLPAPLERGLRLAYRRLSRAGGPAVAVRSSALAENTVEASFAGQLETILGVASAAELLTAVRACWASLWTPRARGYMATRGLDPAGMTVGVLVQRLVRARAAGGALSRAADGRLVLTAAWGLGLVVTQGTVAPDRYVLSRRGAALLEVEPAEKPHRVSCGARGELRSEPVPPDRIGAPCLSPAEAVGLARLVLRVEAILGGPVEIEWALDAQGFHVLQARSLGRAVRGDGSRARPGGRSLRGQAGGGGRAAGPARVVRAEGELSRVGLGDVLVTTVAGPALAWLLPRVAGVVAERGGSTSHLAALARERGIPAVLGVAEATRLIPDGSMLDVDGDEGLVGLDG